MKKYTQAEGELEVLRGLEAQALNDHFAKTGKRAVSDFSDEERKALDADLAEARRQETAINSESGRNGD